MAVHRVCTARIGGSPAAGARGGSVGTLRGHRTGILQLLVLGERLLSLGAEQRLLVWAVGEYGEPLARPRPDCAHAQAGLAARVRRRSPVRLCIAHSGCFVHYCIAEHVVACGGRTRGTRRARECPVGR